MRVVAVSVGCAAILVGAGARADVSTPRPNEAPTVAAGQVPAVLIKEWRKAENRRSCAPVWFDDLGAATGATVRATYFGGGWGVALDKTGMPGRGKGIA